MRRHAIVVGTVALSLAIWSVLSASAQRARTHAVKTKPELTDPVSAEPCVHVPGNDRVSLCAGIGAVRKRARTPTTPATHLGTWRVHGADRFGENLELTQQIQMAGGLGFEPRLTESESAVLPLNYPPIGKSYPRV